jgi:DNA-binding NarL/FixJ family response regulator
MYFLIVDDHPLLRASMRLLLGQNFLNCQVEEAQDAASAGALLPQKPWDVILLDLDLPDRSGADFLCDIAVRAPRARTLVFSAAYELDYGPRVIKAGASGFLHKTAPEAEILAAIKRVLARKTYISPDLAASLAVRSLESGHASPLESLSGREMEVLRLLGKGCPSKEIANRLTLSAKTVSTYRARILQKLGLQSTGEIVRYAVNNGV